MNIDEGLSKASLKRVKQNHSIIHLTQMGKSDDDLFSHQFSPKGRAGGSHLLRY